MTPQPTGIRKIGDAEVRITWDDGHESVFSARYLRENCRCATCQHELTGEPLLDPKSLPEKMTMLKPEIIGNYALGFTFSDGHSTGIYTFKNLRDLCPCPSCRHD